MVSRGELCSVINAEVNKVFAEFSPRVCRLAAFSHGNLLGAGDGLALSLIR